MKLNTGKSACNFLHSSRVGKLTNVQVTSVLCVCVLTNTGSCSKKTRQGQQFTTTKVLHGSLLLVQLYVKIFHFGNLLISLSLSFCVELTLDSKKPNTTH